MYIRTSDISLSSLTSDIIMSSQDVFNDVNQKKHVFFGHVGMVIAC